MRAAARRSGAGDDAETARWLLERVRVNSLDRARLQLAARCGHRAARLALPEVRNASLHELLGQAERVDPLVGVVVAATIAADAAETLVEPHLARARELVLGLEEFLRTKDRELARRLADLHAAERGPTRSFRIHAWLSVRCAARAPWAWCAPMRAAALAGQVAQDAFDTAIRTDRGVLLDPVALQGRVRARLGAWAVE